MSTNVKLTRVVIADSARVRFFSMLSSSDRIEDATLTPSSHMEHARSRAKVTDLVTDQPGRAFGSSGHGNRSAVVPHADPKETEAHVFARKIVRALSDDRTRFRGLVLVAPPHFLGLLRGEMTPELARMVVGTLDKDLMHLGNDEIVERLPQLVEAALPAA